MRLTSRTVKFLIKIDDAMDVFAEHAVAGMVGLIFNALFGATYIIGLDGVNTASTSYPGGWLDRNFRQLYKQLAYIGATAVYTFVVSALIAYGINFIPGLRLRASDEAELLGMDDDQLGEFAYDYVEVRRDYLAWTPRVNQGANGQHDVAAADRHGIPEHSDMIEGRDPHYGSEHTGIGGDRHAIGLEKHAANGVS